MNKLAERLTEERVRLGSLRAAARAMGVATGTYEAWEKGWRQPRPKNYAVIAKFFEVEVPVILGWLGWLTEEQVADLNRAMGVSRTWDQATAAA